MRLQAFNASAIAAIALVTVCTSSAWFLLDDDDRERSTAPTYWTAEKNYNFKDETKLLSERDFQRIFRLHRRGFDDLVLGLFVALNTHRLRRIFRHRPGLLQSVSLEESTHWLLAKPTKDLSQCGYS